MQLKLVSYSPAFWWPTAEKVLAKLTLHNVLDDFVKVSPIGTDAPIWKLCEGRPAVDLFKLVSALDGDPQLAVRCVENAVRIHTVCAIEDPDVTTEQDWKKHHGGDLAKHRAKVEVVE